MVRSAHLATYGPIRGFCVIRGYFVFFAQPSRHRDTGKLSCLPGLCGCVTLLLAAPGV